MICEYCGYEIPGNNKFCINCGKPVVSNKPELDSGWACGSCHAPLTLGDKFCCACGTPVAWDDDQTDPAAAAPVAWGAAGDEPIREHYPAGWPDDDYEEDDEATVALGSHREYDDTEAYDPGFGERGSVSGGGRYGERDFVPDGPGYGERYPGFGGDDFGDDEDTSNIESLIPPEFGYDSDPFGAPGRGGRYGDDWEPVDPGDWRGGEPTVPGGPGRGPAGSPIPPVEDYDDTTGTRPKLMGDLTGERPARPAAGYGKPKHFKKPQDF